MDEWPQSPPTNSFDTTSCATDGLVTDESPSEGFAADELTTDEVTVTDSPLEASAEDDRSMHDDTPLGQARSLLDGLDGAEATPAQVADTLDQAVALLRDALQASAPD
jgi:hypothetical protein